MTKASVVDNPNIRQHPQHHAPIAAFGKIKKWSTVGDLHGNALYFIYFGLLCGAMHLPSIEYTKLAKLYHDWKGTAEQKLEFETLLKYVEVADGAKIRLIGDELADRGKGDDLMLKALARFQNENGVIETILSNHTATFILLIEDAIANATENGIVDNEKFKSEFMTKNNSLLKDPSHVTSFSGLQQSLRNGTITAEELLQLYDKHKKTFKAFSYDYGLNGQLTIYSHAAIGKKTIIDVADEMKQYFNDSEQAALDAIGIKITLVDTDMIPLIDAINRVIQYKAQQNKLNELFIIGTGKEATGKTLYMVLQNRSNPHDDDINNVHGHDWTTFGRRISLDGLFGKPMAGFAYAMQYLVSLPWRKKGYQIKAKGHYGKQGAGIGFVASATLLGLFVAATFIADSKDFDASALFKQLADWMNPSPAHCSATAVLGVTSGMFIGMGTAMGAFAGRRTLNRTRPS